MPPTRTDELHQPLNRRPLASPHAVLIEGGRLNPQSGGQLHIRKVGSFQQTINQPRNGLLVTHQNGQVGGLIGEGLFRGGRGDGINGGGEHKVPSG